MMKNTHNSQERLDYLKQQLPLEISRSVADTLREDLGGSLDADADITASLTRISEEILPFFSTGI